MYSRNDIDNLAAELNFIRDNMEKVVRLGTILEYINSDPLLANYLVRNGGGAAAESASQAPALISYGTNIVLSVILGLLIALLLPFGKWGRKLADKAGAKPPAFKFTLLNAIPLAVGNTILISLALSAFGVWQARSNAALEALAHMPPFLVMWLPSWAKLLLPTLVASYLVSVILSPVVSDMIGLTSAGAEVGKASAKDVSIAAKRRAAEKKAAKEAEAAEAAAKKGKK